MIFSCMVFLQSVINLSLSFGKKKDRFFSKKRDVLSIRVKKDVLLRQALLGREMHPVVPILLLCYVNAHTKSTDCE